MSPSGTITEGGERDEPADRDRSPSPGSRRRSGEPPAIEPIEQLTWSENVDVDATLACPEMLHVSGDDRVDRRGNRDFDEGEIPGIRELERQRNADHVLRVAHQLEKLVDIARGELQFRPAKDLSVFTKDAAVDDEVEITGDA
jgi:hypothetical protein